MNKKYWLKGGVFGVFLYTLTSVALIPFGLPSHCSFFCAGDWFVPTFLGGGVLTLFLPGNLQLNGYMFFVLATVCYFTLGSLIGMVYEKIKN